MQRPSKAFDEVNVVLVDGVELEERVVDPEERAEDAVPDDVGGVGEDAHLAFRRVLVAKRERVVDDALKVGVRGGLAVAREGDRVGQDAFGLHALELGAKGFAHGFTRGHPQLGTVLAVEAAFAVDAVEAAELAVGGQQVDAERNA